MYNQNFTDDDSDNSQTSSPQDKARKRNDIQRDIVIQESDYKKKMNEKLVIDAEIRSLKKKEAQLKVEIQDRQERVQRLEQDIMMMEVELKGLRKKLNVIV